ncbi:hypothetical protein OG369_41630 [Streptomyces sp. NBC_01221]|uniref:hypothetical protein n=1 Tax=Streptomyces sp. NBC_01221 TaxID=2903782 RepID=UPI00225AB19A|nr:hypothetical protein [Streptomyces sp. NBC_01221]MCX4792304.1 hypothetical protein [Streptomyces sp. NBC_01221]
MGGDGHRYPPGGLCGPERGRGTDGQDPERAHVRGVRDILGRIAPIMPLITAAEATDPEIAAQ